MVVSVVTCGVSGDANAFTIEGDHIWLRVSRVDETFANHAATDGITWQMIRYFALDDPHTRHASGSALSPVGEGCAVAFDEIRFVQDRLADIRDGS